MEEYLTVPEVARRLRVKATTIRAWIHRGVLGAETLYEGKRNRYRIEQSLIDMMVNADNRRVKQS
jgi:excisionase family DNA binding protein